MPKKGSLTGQFLGAGRVGVEGAWRRFRSPESTSQAVLGSSLEPVILQPRVTWMPGIPEPLGSGLPPPFPLPLGPSALRLPSRCFERESEHKRRLGHEGWGPGFLKVKGTFPCSVHRLPHLLAPFPLPHLQASLLPCPGAPLRDTQAHGFILVARNGQGLRTPNLCQGFRGYERWQEATGSKRLDPPAPSQGLRKARQLALHCSLIAMGKTEFSGEKSLVNLTTELTPITLPC